MKRRDMIKAAGALAATPLFLNENLASLGSDPDFVQIPSIVKRFGDGRDWFFQKRYGMFVHWGLYSIPGWHEQHQWRAKVQRAQYVKLANQWNPVKFNPEEWLDLIEKAGMKYITVTTKHHDGFCLWDTKLTRFNTMNTPYKQDIIGKLSDSCHRRGIPLCLYYSIADWNHFNYPNQGRHHELSGPEKGDQPDWDKYMEFLKGQVSELCTNYGEIHGFWWDMNVPLYKDPSINNMIRKLQPKAVINNRGFDDGDFGTPERDYEIKPTDAPESQRPVEACQSVGMESWGYKKDEDYYTDRHLTRSIDKYLSRDANYLLNVGPTGEGIIPEESSSILKRLGLWYSAVKESYEDVAQSFQPVSNPNVMFTSRGNTLYLHFNKDLIGNGFKLKPINVLPKSAILLNDGSKVDCAVNLCPSDHIEQKAYLRLRNLPANRMENTVLVVQLEFERPLSEISLGKPETGIVTDWEK
jgi:alpha-L-fucosidase